LRSSNRFARCYQQTKSQQIVGSLPHSFLLLESATRADYPPAPIQRRFGFIMSERQQSPYDSITRRWLALVERRQHNFIELCNTGRWRHYYTHAQFLDEMRKVLHLRNQWARLAGLPVSEQANLQQIELQPSIKQGNRPEQELGAQQATPLSDSAIALRRPASAILAAVAGRL
jgi:hypothetical protein